MKHVELLSGLVGRWFAVIVIAAGVIAFLLPDFFASGAPAVNWLLATIMLGMGMTLRASDFAIVAKRPWALITGVAAQFIVMPLAGYGLAVALDLSPALAAGMVLVGAAPGGTASNVIVYLARGDTALSVAMTTVSTLLAPLLTPAIVLLLADEFMNVDAGSLFTSIAQIVLLPVLLGVLLRTLAGGLVERVVPALPLVSVFGIAVVVAIVIGGSADTLRTVGLTVVLAVILHNALGLSLGYAIAKVCRLDVPGRRAVSVEVGMQNSGLAAALASAHFNPAAALPAAIFSVWHNISGPILASRWSRRPVRSE
ncbi:bile acid:sodium symporter family protein [Demetria terragena]|uniref:bile acid:sodium symporter family protein n=1 Tax=Demetria terragena TaxID=63959 RepID=UPI000373FF9E|nr:bile acid:sodium symporter family protein [Demetria terragena]